ncbi:salivary lipocalin [Echinococcus multilocularis]|uniref:Salivary lipocalin n=1 Tax=Echinococcus multilocularis TaxID=6211 RepID=A0A0S4MM02_ECHMU|nr:salivary lipocalin [Echinococcus multilocularis]
MGYASSNSGEENSIRCEGKKGDEAALAVTTTNTNVTIDHCCPLTGLNPTPRVVATCTLFCCCRVHHGRATSAAAVVWNANATLIPLQQQ